MTTILDKVRPLCAQTAQLLKPIQLDERDRLHISVDAEHKRFTLTATYHVYTSNPTRWLHRFPEKKYVGNGILRVPATDTTALILEALWPEEHRVYEDEDAKILLGYLSLSFTAQLERAEKQAAFKEHRTTTFEDDVLAPYQKAVLDCSIGAESYGLFMEQGTGKTICVIRRVDEEAKKVRNRPYRVLIVCPKALRLNWELEIRKFAKTKNVGVYTFRNGKLGRLKTLIEALGGEHEVTYLITSYEGMHGSLKSLCTVQWDLGVLDESHYIKSPFTKRSKNALILRDSCSSRMALTGTPITNHAGDLFNQFEFLGKGFSGFVDYKRFMEFYMRLRQVNQHTTIFEGMQNVPLLQERLVRQAFLITKKQALPDLPDKVHDIVEVEMEKEQRDIYAQAAESILVEIEDDLDNTTNRSMTMNNALTKLLRLAQITSGFVTFDRLLMDDGELSSAVIQRIDPNPKIEKLVEILKEKQPHEKTIVWACWVQDLKTIEARLKLEGIDVVMYYGATSEEDRQIAIERFNTESRCKVFLGNPQCAGIGLNLLGNSSEEDACDHIIYFSQNWSPGIRSQSEDRAHRRGTKRTVRITDLCVPGTIDQQIRERVVDKRLTAFRIQDVRELLGKLLEAVR